MPASSFVALNAWALYLVAASALILVLSPALVSTSQDSREGADWRSVDGVRTIFDSLRPGVAVVFTFGVSPSADPIRLNGHELNCSYGVGTIEMESGWPLQTLTIYPGLRYVATLSQGGVKVTQTG